MSDIGNKEIFSKNLLYYVKMSGRDQKEIAEYVGVAPSTFNEWIKAKKYPRIDKIEKLANYFGILKSDLIEEKIKKKSPEEPKLTEGEKLMLEAYRRASNDVKPLLVDMVDKLGKAQLQEIRMAADLIRVALHKHQ